MDTGCTHLRIILLMPVSALQMLLQTFGGFQDQVRAPEGVGVHERLQSLQRVTRRLWTRVGRTA